MYSSKLYKDALVQGPYFNNKNQRWFVCIYYGNKDNRNQTMWLARYLMQEHLNRILESSEHVDHKDENKLNDNLENLQILTETENTVKRNKSLAINPEELIVFCSFCSKEIKMNRQKQKDRAKAEREGRNGPFCNRKCSSQYGVSLLH